MASSAADPVTVPAHERVERLRRQLRRRSSSYVGSTRNYSDFEDAGPLQVNTRSPTSESDVADDASPSSPGAPRSRISKTRVRELIRSLVQGDLSPSQAEMNAATLEDLVLSLLDTLEMQVNETRDQLQSERQLRRITESHLRRLDSRRDTSSSVTSTSSAPTAGTARSSPDWPESPQAPKPRAFTQPQPQPPPPLRRRSLSSSSLFSLAPSHDDLARRSLSPPPPSPTRRSASAIPRPASSTAAAAALPVDVPLAYPRLAALLADRTAPFASFADDSSAPPPLPTARVADVSQLPPPSPSSADGVNRRLSEELCRARAEATALRLACTRLEQLYAATVSSRASLFFEKEMLQHELESLTSALFEEANQMVAAEARLRHELQSSNQQLSEELRHLMASLGRAGRARTMRVGTPTRRQWLANAEAWPVRTARQCARGDMIAAPEPQRATGFSETAAPREMRAATPRRRRRATRDSPADDVCAGIRGVSIHLEEDEGQPSPPRRNAPPCAHAMDDVSFSMEGA